MNASEDAPWVIGIGELLWDEYVDRSVLGGAPANFAIHAAALDCRASLISSIGDDELGEQAVKELNNRRVDSRWVSKHPDLPTGIVRVRLDERGEPSYKILSNVAWDAIAWSAKLKKVALQCDALCFGTLAQRCDTSKSTLLRFIQTTKQDCLRVFDVNLRQKHFDGQLIYDSLSIANVLKTNLLELEIVAAATQTMGRNIQKTIERLAIQFELAAVVVTKGSQGSDLWLRGQFASHALDSKTKVVDTVGAGDAYTAATVYGMLKSWSAVRIVQFASRIAAFVCTQSGATPTIPASIIGET